MKSVDQTNITFQYVDDHGIPTDRYPNPNGSIHGTAALTSFWKTSRNHASSRKVLFKMAVTLYSW